MSVPIRLAIAIVVSILAVAGCGGATVVVPASGGPSASIGLASVPASAITMADPSPSPVSSETRPASSGPTRSSPLPALPATTASTAALAGFVRKIAAPDRSFHMAQTGSTDLGGVDVGAFTYDLDAAGKDLASTSAAFGPILRIIAVGDKAWVKLGDLDWRSVPRDDASLADILDVFRYVGEPHELVYVGSANEGDTTVEHFRNDAPSRTRRQP